jgi:hypothetical protein
MAFDTSPNSDGLGETMESLNFIATEAGVDDDEYALVAGLGTDDPDLNVTFQRDPKDGPGDCGVHFGFNDQINSAYECIRQCTLSRRKMHVELLRPIDPQKRILHVNIELQIPDDDFDTFASMLRRIFRQREHLLTILVGDEL